MDAEWVTTLLIEAPIRFCQNQKHIFVKFSHPNPADSPALPPTLTRCGFCRPHRLYGIMGCYNYSNIMISIELTWRRLPAYYLWAPTGFRATEPYANLRSPVLNRKSISNRDWKLFGSMYFTQPLPSV